MKLIAPLFFAAIAATVGFSSLAQEAKPEPAAAAMVDVAKGEANFAAVCIACHGPEGNSLVPTFPKLAQQHPEYLIKQLQEFKSDKRSNPIMKGIATVLSDEDMKNVAYWVSSKAAKPGAAKEKDQIVLGERIYRGGIADRQVPACAGCHSPNGAGIPAQFPRLAGQHADYAVAQLTAFRDGVRTNSLQMAQIAAKLNDREIRALADYISGLH
jgi:cytochrome c553